MKRALSLILVTMLVLSLTGCDFDFEIEESTTETASKANEEAINRLIKTDDLPKITRSLERENIKRRIEFINQPDNVGYLYLISENGQLIREIQVLGKVSSLNSYLTPNYIEEYYANGAVINTEQADLDGTWGENAGGIFWFDMNGAYGEWSGLYLYSSQRMTFTTQPLLIEIVQ